MEAKAASRNGGGRFEPASERPSLAKRRRSVERLPLAVTLASACPRNLSFFATRIRCGTWVPAGAPNLPRVERGIVVRRLGPSGPVQQMVSFVPMRKQKRSSLPFARLGSSRPRYRERLTSIRRFIARDKCPLHVCAVRRRRFPVGASPTRQTLQPEATGAVMEVTKWLKPSV